MMIRKILCFCGLGLLFPQTFQAQDIATEMREFDEFIKQQQKEFSDFVSEQNREFIQFLKENWKSYNSEQTEKRPKRPEPVNPVKVDRKAPSGKPVQIDVDAVQKIPVVTPSVTFPELGDGKPEKEDGIRPGLADTESLSFDFYGMPCRIGKSMKQSVHLTGISEREVSAGWERLSKRDYQSLVNACSSIKNMYRLNDYAYLLLVQKVAEVLLDQKNVNDVVLLQAFILCQSGYKVKMARIGDELGLLYASKDLIYATTYLTIDGEKYYKWGKMVKTGTPIYTYRKDFADSKYQVSMGLLERPAFAGSVITKSLQSKKFPNLKVTSQVYEGLMDFYKDYPQCDLSVYLNAPISEIVEENVINVLNGMVKGKTKVVAANMLIDFVQTAFAYQTDTEQFGYEKPFFVDEMFYYPYCDCEDRAIFYAYLVRSLLDLDVVLLDYPNHIATAVCFGEQVEGDYVMVNGKKYIICDPTYIGASIGMAMPQFKSVSAKVLMF